MTLRANIGMLRMEDTVYGNDYFSKVREKSQKRGLGVSLPVMFRKHETLL